MERENKCNELQESRLCVSGIRVRFRWESMGRFSQKNKMQRWRKVENYQTLRFYEDHFKIYLKKETNILIKHVPYKTEHTDSFV